MSEVVRPAGLGTNNLEDDIPEQPAKDLRRLRRPTLQQRLQLGNPLSDPLLSGNGESRTGTGTKSIKLGLKPTGTILSPGKLLRDRLTLKRLPESDELDQMVHTLLSIGKLSLLTAAHVSDITGQLGELVPDTTKSMADGAWLEKPVADGREEDPLNLRPLHCQPVLADTTHSRRAPIEPALLPANERDGAVTRRAPEHATEQMGRVDLGTRALTLRETTAPAPGEDLGHLLSALPRGVPQGLRDDPEILVNKDNVDILGLGTILLL